jgi:hypothetical protein
MNRQWMWMPAQRRFFSRHGGAAASVMTITSSPVAGLMS